MILVILRKQIRATHPENNSPPMIRYKGILKLLFIMIYFTISVGFLGLYTVLILGGAIPIDMSDTGFLIYAFSQYVVLITTPFLNITI